MYILPVTLGLQKHLDLSRQHFDFENENSPGQSLRKKKKKKKKDPRCPISKPPNPRSPQIKKKFADVVQECSLSTFLNAPPKDRYQVHIHISIYSSFLSSPPYYLSHNPKPDYIPTREVICEDTNLDFIHTHPATSC